MMKIQIDRKMYKIVTSKLVLVEGSIVTCVFSGTFVDDAVDFFSVFFFFVKSDIIVVIWIVAMVMLELIICV